jgi:VIT1/CCC1 family predicted Fe2+/Mn2+ transporter
MLMVEGEAHDAHAKLVLKVGQPGLAGLTDGSVSTLAPIFATVFASHSSHAAFLIGAASAVGAGISMGVAEGLSDDGTLTGRGSPLARGSIVGGGTFLGGIIHTLPFLIANVHVALVVAVLVVAVELTAIAWIRHRYMRARFVLSVLQVVGGGALVFAAAALIGSS